MDDTTASQKRHLIKSAKVPRKSAIFGRAMRPKKIFCSQSSIQPIQLSFKQPSFHHHHHHLLLLPPPSPKMKFLLSLCVALTLPFAAHTAVSPCVAAGTTYYIKASENIVANNGNTSVPTTVGVQSAFFYSKKNLTKPLGYATTTATYLQIPGGSSVGCVGVTTMKFLDGKNMLTMSRSCDVPETRPVLGSFGPLFPCGTGRVVRGTDTVLAAPDTLITLKVIPQCKC